MCVQKRCMSLRLIQQNPVFIHFNHLPEHLYTNYFLRQHFLTWRFDLYQRPSTEEACSTLLPVLATVVMWRGKKLIWNKLLLTEVSGRDRNVKVIICVRLSQKSFVYKCVISLKNMFNDLTEQQRIFMIIKPMDISRSTNVLRTIYWLHNSPRCSTSFRSHLPAFDDNESAWKHFSQNISLLHYPRGVTCSGHMTSGSNATWSVPTSWWWAAAVYARR